MSLFVIDEEACLKDGLCAAECPAGCIDFRNEHFPVPHEKRHAYCLDCGHCVAVCPTGAFRLNRFSGSGERIERTNRLSPEQATQFLRARRSVRTFKNEPLERETLRELLDVTQYAPSGHNVRPVRWSVAHTPERVRDIAEIIVAWMRREAEAETELAQTLHLPGIVKAWDNGIDMICRNAPALAVAHGPKHGVTPLEDGVIGITYLELAATGAGFGACWCGYALLAARYDETVRRSLGVAQNAMVYGALMLGRPVRRFSRIPPRPGAEVDWL